MTDSTEILPPAETLQAEATARPATVAGYRPLLLLSIGVLTAFVGISVYVLWDEKASPEVRGAIVQTWNNLAVAVGAFWFGSNVASKVSSLRDGR